MPATVHPFPSAAPSPWFTVRAEAGGKGVIDIRGTIGLEKYWQEEYGIDAAGTVSEFDQAVKDLGNVSQIEMNIYSPGGEVFAALAMHAILVRHPARVVANIDGFAGSSATILMLAADEIRMPENAYLMIHNASWGGWGDHRALSGMADQLRKWDRDMANLYAARIEDNTQGDRAAILSDIIAKMDAETWLTGAEAKALGLVETLSGAVDLAACVGGALPRPVLATLSRDRVPEPLRPLLFDRPEPSMSTPAIAPSPTAEAVTTAPVETIEAPAADPTAPVAEVEAEVEPSAPVAEVAPVAPEAPAAPAAPSPAAELTLDAIRSVVAEAVNPLAERLANTEKALAHEQSLRASGVPQNAWGNQQPTEIPNGDEPQQPDLATMSAAEKIRYGREQMHRKP